MKTVLSREDIIKGLKALSHKAQQRGVSADIYVVGGAALALKYFDRQATVDIDARAQQWDQLEPIVDEIAQENGWVSDWFNVAAAQFVPTLGKEAEWVSLHSSSGVNIYVASAEVLLMMKLAASRRGRDYRDAELLMATTGLTNRVELEELFEEYFPGDVLPSKASRMLDEIFENGIGPAPLPPQDPSFS